MGNYRRSSIQDPKDPSRSSGWFSHEHKDHPDGWLQEHRYRWAVATLRELQRSFTSELCDAVAELMRLVVWRDEMGRKVLCNFCTKLHQVA
ncbi:unnamed protein product [Cladocopium goreaui]|uniref:Uncharacterized protein n=1 Tax=Cladocopium goreaui TaxID=2562237 RepID=A0A9P1GBL3_9DINO|nr:unnamed protein product [Cladocopium goreaui]